MDEIERKIVLPLVPFVFPDLVVSSTGGETINWIVNAVSVQKILQNFFHSRNVWSVAAAAEVLASSAWLKGNWFCSVYSIEGGGGGGGGTRTHTHSHTHMRGTSVARWAIQQRTNSGWLGKGEREREGGSEGERGREREREGEREGERGRERERGRVGLRLFLETCEEEPRPAAPLTSSPSLSPSLYFLSPSLLPLSPSLSPFPLPTTLHHRWHMGHTDLKKLLFELFSV